MTHAPEIGVINWLHFFLVPVFHHMQMERKFLALKINVA